MGWGGVKFQDQVQQKDSVAIFRYTSIKFKIFGNQILTVLWVFFFSCLLLVRTEKQK